MSNMPNPTQVREAGGGDDLSQASSFNECDDALGACSSECSSRMNISTTERILSAGVGGMLTLFGLWRRGWDGLLVALGGGALLYRGATGYCHGYAALGIDTAEHPEATVVPAQAGERAEKSVAIQASPYDLFTFWRNAANLSRVLPHVKSVTPRDANRSHWVAEGPMGTEVTWDAEIFNESENELIAWRSLPGGDLDTSGSIRFQPLFGERGTQVTLNLKYNPPGGKVGAALAWISGYGLENEITEGLRRLKEIFEVREIPRSQPQIETEKDLAHRM